MREEIKKRAETEKQHNATIKKVIDVVKIIFACSRKEENSSDGNINQVKAA